MIDDSLYLPDHWYWLIVFLLIVIIIYLCARDHTKSDTSRSQNSTTSTARSSSTPPLPCTSPPAYCQAQQTYFQPPYPQQTSRMFHSLPTNNSASNSQNIETLEISALPK
ncbi:hypothetical protein Ddc_07489 [Ditylenchus destructor]|nr:hypothetical protein Ddc_07489 [Ditylenchus destructor]